MSATFATQTAPKGTLHYVHPNVPGGWADPKIHNIPKDPRPLRMVKMGEFFNWLEPGKRLSPISLVYAFRRKAMTINGLGRHPAGHVLAGRFLPIVGFLGIYTMFNNGKQGGHCEMYRGAKYH